MDGVNAHLGERIRSRREQLGFSRSQLASQLGITAATLRDLELGNQRPKPELLVSIASALGVTLAYLFEDPDRRPM